MTLLRCVLVAVLPVCAWVPRSGAQSQRGVIDGIVTDTSRAPLADVTVSILGSSVRAVTGNNGRFRIPEVTPSQYIVHVQRLGFKATSMIAQVVGGDTVHMSFALSRMTTLDPVTVAAAQVPPRLQEFEERQRLHEATVSLTREEILARHPVATWELFRGVAGGELVALRNGGYTLQSSREQVRLVKGQPAMCGMTVFLDGARVGGSGYDLRDLPQPEEIYGIEIFAGAASIPLRYASAVVMDGSCGVIAVWTR